MTPYDLGYSFGLLIVQYVYLMASSCLLSPVIIAVTLGALWIKKRGAQ